MAALKFIPLLHISIKGNIYEFSKYMYKLIIESDFTSMKYGILQNNNCIYNAIQYSISRAGSAINAIFIKEKGLYNIYNYFNFPRILIFFKIGKWN